MSPTERAAQRIANLVARGRTNREIATELGVSEKTIEWHLSRLYRKLGVRSRTELAVVVLGGLPGRPSPTDGTPAS